MNKSERLLLEKRKAAYDLLNRPQYLMVTFDLVGAAGREALYARFRKHLGELVGAENVVRSIKQVYLVKSIYSPADIKFEMKTLLQRQDSILITRLQPGQSYSLKAPGAGRKAKEFFKQLDADEGDL